MGPPGYVFIPDVSPPPGGVILVPPVGMGEVYSCVTGGEWFFFIERMDRIIFGDGIV